MEKGKLDKKTNIEENNFELTKNVSLKNQVRLPPIDNAIVVMFEDGIKKVRIETTPYMWDIIKALGEEKVLRFTKRNNETGEALIITVEMETEGAT